MGTMKDSTPATKPRPTPAAGRVALPKIISESNNIRGYENTYKKEVDALNINKQYTGGSMLTYTNRVRKLLKNQSTDEADAYTLTDPFYKKFKHFKKLQKPNRPMSKDFSFPYYKDMHCRKSDIEIFPNDPDLWVGRRSFDALNQLPPMYYSGDLKTIPIQRQERLNMHLPNRVFVTSEPMPKISQGLPTISRNGNTSVSVNSTNPVYFSPRTSQSRSLLKDKLELNAEKVRIHDTGSRIHRSVENIPESTVLDNPAQLPVTVTVSRHSSPDIRFVSDSVPRKGEDAVCVEQKGKFVKGGGYIGRVPINSQCQRKEEERSAARTETTK